MNFWTQARTGAAALATAIAIGAAPASAQTNLNMYFPVAVGGPITAIIDKMAADFSAEHPDINITPIYAGSYQDTITKAITALKGGNPPEFAVILSTDMFTLIDEDAIVAYEDIVTTDEEKAWLDSFYPAFMLNSRTGGKTWGIPFQRSTIVQYWNKDAFKEAGLDPEAAPKTWDELVTTAEKLTKRDGSGNVTQWGVQVPSSGFPYWLFQAFTTQNDVILANEAGTEVTYDDPRVVEALQFWVDLSRKYKVHPEGIVEWGTTPKDFFEGKVAMIWTTTGNLTNVRNNAPFPFGVAMMPAKARGGSPTGGGNFYIFKNASPEQQKAALEFIKWATAPEQAAAWSIATGYVAVTPAAWETEEMKKYVADFPEAAVARDQLEFAVAELSTHDNQRVTKALNDGLQAALTGAEEPGQAMKDSQAEADRILRAFQ